MCYTIGMEDRMLTPVEAAAITGLSRNRIYQAVADGELPRVPGVKPVLVRESDLQKWMAREKKNPGPPPGSKNKAKE